MSNTVKVTVSHIKSKLKDAQVDPAIARSITPLNPWRRLQEDGALIAGASGSYAIHL